MKTTETLPLSFDPRSLAFWILLPFGVPQGLWARQTAPPFPPAAGPPHGRVGYGETLRLFVIGDSVVAGVGAPTLDEALAGRVASALAAQLGREVRWSALGEVGARAAEVRANLLAAMPEKPFDVAVVSVGVNDVVKLDSARRWHRDIGALLDGLRSASANGLIVLAGVPPLSGFPLLPQPMRYLFGLRSRIFDAIGERQASMRRRCIHLPTVFNPGPGSFSSDGFHPSEATYSEWGARLAAGLAPSLARCL